MVLINTGRGGELDTEAALAALRRGQFGYLRLAVYEHGHGLFFENNAQQMPHDDTYAQLLAQPNVLITGHQAFLTCEALTNLAGATVASLTCWAAGQPSATKLRQG